MFSGSAPITRTSEVLVCILRKVAKVPEPRVSTTRAITDGVECRGAAPAPLRRQRSADR